MQSNNQAVLGKPLIIEKRFRATRRNLVLQNVPFPLSMRPPRTYFVPRPIPGQFRLRFVHRQVSVKHDRERGKITIERFLDSASARNQPFVFLNHRSIHGRWCPGIWKSLIVRPSPVRLNFQSRDCKYSWNGLKYSLTILATLPGFRDFFNNFNASRHFSLEKGTFTKITLLNKL